MESGDKVSQNFVHVIGKIDLIFRVFISFYSKIYVALKYSIADHVFYLSDKHRLKQVEMEQYFLRQHKLQKLLNFVQFLMYQSMKIKTQKRRFSVAKTTKKIKPKGRT